MANVKCNKRAAVECTLYVNTRSGYMFTPQRFPSISQAVRAGRDGGGFAWYVCANGKRVRQGYCN